METMSSKDLYKYKDDTYIYERIYMKEYITSERIHCDYNSECGNDGADAMTRVRAVRLRSN